MKTFLVKLAVIGGLFAFAAMSATAQDIIVLRTGDLIQSKVQEITPTEIKYKKFSNPDGPLYTILKSTVLAINYQNGEKETFADATPTAVPATETTPPTEDASISAEENEALKKKYDVEVGYNEESKEKEEKKSKDAKSFYCQFDFTKDAQLADKNIEISMQYARAAIGSRPYTETIWCANNPALQITVRNKTNKVLFLDLANCFFIRGTEASPYYIPTSTSSTAGGQTGVGVNLGGITNALGVGGAVGALANGVTVGGGKSHSETTTTFSQRIISIPPMSSKKLDPMLIVTAENPNAYDIGVLIKDTRMEANGVCPYFQNIGLKRGEIRSWDENESPIKMATYITYSFDESLQSVYNVKTSLFVKKMIAIPRAPGGYFFPTSNFPVVLTPNWEKALYFPGEFQ